jgi:hypothetical protein
VSSGQAWTSPLLGISFWLTQDGGLGIRLPDGRLARSHEELLHDWRAEQASALAERERADRLAAKLRELGLDPDAL